MKSARSTSRALFLLNILLIPGYAADGIEERGDPFDNSLRLRVQTVDGVLVVYDSAAAPLADGPGYVAYWFDAAGHRVVVHSRIIYNPLGLGQAMVALQRDLHVDLGLMMSKSDVIVMALVEAWSGNGEKPDQYRESHGAGRGAKQKSAHKPHESRDNDGAKSEDATWVVASREAVWRVMGFDEPLPGAVALSAPTPDHPEECPESAGTDLGPPPDPDASPDELFDLAVASAGCCPGIFPPPGCSINCNDGDPCTREHINCCPTPGCTYTARCTPLHCCESGACCSSAAKCCPGGTNGCCADNYFCCPDQSHCCADGTTCCGQSACCIPPQECCMGQCALKGRCCLFDSGACLETTQNCCSAEGGTFYGAGTTCVPADICRPECENCHSLNLIFNECRHETADPAEPCSMIECTKNWMESSTCDYFPHRLGPPQCNTADTGAAGEVMQIRYLLPIPTICVSSNPGGFHEWTTTWAGCGSTCDGALHIVRCDTTPCQGQIVSEEPRGTIKACNFCP